MYSYIYNKVHVHLKNCLKFIKRSKFIKMESSELVQRLQAQVLELRADNCEFKERDKYSKKKLNEIDQQREELEKQLKSELRKNKALSFLPGQSGLMIILWNVINT